MNCGVASSNWPLTFPDFIIAVTATSSVHRQVDPFGFWPAWTMFNTTLPACAVDPLPSRNKERSIFHRFPFRYDELQLLCVVAQTFS